MWMGDGWVKGGGSVGHQRLQPVTREAIGKKVDIDNIPD